MKLFQLNLTLYSVMLYSVICISVVVCIGDQTSQTSTKSSHKSISIALHSKWKQTPIYLEIFEFIAQQNSQFIWSFIDLMRKQLFDENSIGINELWNRDQYQNGIDLAKQILDSPSKLAILKFSLSLRVFSPRVSMFNQISFDLLNQQNSLNECDAFVEFSIPSDDTIIGDYKRFTCELTQVNHILDTVFKHKSISMTHPILYKLDHIYQSSQLNSTIIVILYGNIALKSFHKFNDYLKQLANEGLIKYVIRHYIKNISENKVSLSGYGVELAIKSTEYKAQDDTRVKGEEVPNSVLQDNDEHIKRDEVDGFIFSNLKSTFPNKTDKLNELHNHLLDNTKEIVTLKVWQLQEISLQAAKKILDSRNSDPLIVMRDISQNFPTEARSLINININNEMKKEIERNQQLFMQNLNLGTSDTAIFVNGLYFDAETIDVFSLLDIFNSEIKLIEGLHQFVDGDSEALKKLIKMDINKNKLDFQIDIRDGAVIYINDIENDKLYRNWPSSLQDMLRPTYPGMLRNVRKNMYHLVLILDPSKKESYDIIKLAESFYVHKAPVRIGLVFAVSSNSSIDGFSDSGVACLEAFNFISQDKTPYEGLSFITDVIATITNDRNSIRDLTPDDVINQFKSKYKNEDLDLIFGGDSDYDTGRKLAHEFILRTGIGQPIKALLNGVVLKETHLNAEQFEEVVLTEIMKQTITIQKAIYKGELTDTNDMLEWLMSQKSVLPRINHLILNTEETDLNNKYIDFNGDFSVFKNLNVFKNLSLHDIELAIYANLKYIKTNKDKCNPITVWLAANFDTLIGRNLLIDAITHLRSNSLAMRIAIIYNSFGSVSKIIESAISVIDSMSNLAQFLLKFLKEIKDLNIEESNEKILDIALLHLNSDYHKKFKNIFNSLSADSFIFKLHNDFCVKILNIGIDESAVVINGRVIQIPISEPFTEEDFNLLEKYFMSSFTDKILSELNIDDKYDAEKCSDLVMKINCISLANPQSKTRHDIKFVSDQHSVLNLEPNQPNIPFIDVTVILDPLTRGAQKLTPILIAFQKVYNLRIKIFFNCVEKHSEMPLKSFFRFVIDTEPLFSNDGQLSISRAFFSSMPTTPLLTLGMAIPDNWIVESTKAIYDLDNIHLADIDENDIWAYFELEHLLLEGHCFEQTSGNPPRGLQFTLGTTSAPVLVDTIVMANLGYFQLKANPGSWVLRLRQGRSDDIYSIISHEGTDSHSNAKDVVSLISSFKSHVIKIRVNKKVGKQNEELLYDSEDEDYDDVNSLWNTFSWSSSPKKKSDINITNDIDTNRINVFSVATGHLYERLLRIMMLSVLKNTNTSVKFWLLKNYLSPSFKEVLPFMAEKYKFEYELVQYKWPRWLHQQTEKQRIIWGYKILFLDVLFPLDVKKIIFVDADQVVRADLKELRDLDLEGAPYGYTPFCDSRTDMEGYRFWKTGYWATHLHNRKYHISALYVVDLQKFRRIAAGDRLRGQYQGLSQDPNSLSNLDQDLPNNMIHQVSIKSLPQDWLWCETWCSDQSKKTAKTIDLCNNPKTKEPKLTAARRILPEWQGYDLEIKALIKLFEHEKNNRTINDILNQNISTFAQTVTSNQIHHQHREL